MHSYEVIVFAGIIVTDHFDETIFEAEVEHWSGEAYPPQDFCQVRGTYIGIYLGEELKALFITY